MARRKYPPYYVGPGEHGAGTGGTEYNPGQPSPKPTPASPETEGRPPDFTYDPSIEAQRREAQRGLEDTEADTKTKTHFAQTDLKTALRDLHVKAKRGRQDINRSANRAQRKLGYQETDANTRAGRANEDFNRSLSNIARGFGQLGHRQAEQANAAGVLDRGTMTAAATARAGNQAVAEEPIHIAQQRTGEDLLTTLKRIGTGRQETEADQNRSLARLAQDVKHERQGAKRETSRKEFGYTREEERARREGQYKNVDLIAQEIYAARQEHPAVFAKWVKQHPEAMQKAKEEAQGPGSAEPQNKPKNKHRKGKH